MCRRAANQVLQMIFPRRPFTETRRIAAAIFWMMLLCCSNARAQNVILHLRNGDRIAGTIVSETPKKVTLSTVWIKELDVPVDQIDSRETLPASPVTAVVPGKGAKTNTVAVIKIVPGPPNPLTNDWWHRWKGEIAIGSDLERGSTDHDLYYGRAKLTYSQPYLSDPKEFFTEVIGYDAEYGKTDGTLSDNRMTGTSKTSFDLTRKYYLYNLGEAGYDRIRLINLHVEDGPGGGYHWITHTNFAVNLELGANYQSDEHSDGTHIREAYYRFGQDLTWKINKQLSLTEKYEYFPRANSPSEFRMRFESNLSYALILNFSLNFTVVDFYDTQPAATVPNNDFQFRTTLGVKF
jgi:putative salt-induced outer membrane protein YdiY